MNENFFMRHLSHEEIVEKLIYFPEGFKERFGEELNLMLLKEFLFNELKRIELQMIKEGFSNLSPHSLRFMIQILDEKLKPKTPDVKTKSHKK